MSVEIWKDIPGYEGLYQVSDRGRVKALAQKVLTKNGHSRTYKERIIGAYDKAWYRYPHVKLTKDGVQIGYSIHCLVLLAFVGPCPEGMECRHFPDRDPKNNNLSNLQWGTKTENCQDKIVHGTSWIGRRHTASARRKMSDARRIGMMKYRKLTWDQVDEIRYLRKEHGMTLRALGAKYGVHDTTILAILQNRTWVRT